MRPRPGFVQVFLLCLGHGPHTYRGTTPFRSPGWHPRKRTVASWAPRPAECHPSPRHQSTGSPTSGMLGLGHYPTNVPHMASPESHNVCYDPEQGWVVWADTGFPCTPPMAFAVPILLIERSRDSERASHFPSVIQQIHHTIIMC